MEENKNMTKYQILGVPQNIIFQNESYTFKKELINSFVSYRCINRKCNASLKISLEDAKKIENKEEGISEIDFTVVGNHDVHKSEKKFSESTDKIKTEKENLELAKKLIKNNLQMPLSFHIQNLNTNKIIISNNKLKNLLQSLREENFPKDDIFIRNIDLIKIDLGDTDILKNLNFCLYKEDFINPKNNKLEKILFFGTKFQLNLLGESEELYIDGTFKMSPKNYYQILNVWGYLKRKKIYVPLIHILMTSKTYTAYNHVFNAMLLLLNDNNIEYNFKKKIITTDYERALRTSIKDIIKPKALNGCYFHFVKALWKKCREYGLTCKKLREDSILLVFCLKIYPYIHNNKRNSYLEKLKSFINGKDPRYGKMVKYFTKNWFNNKSYNFNRISKDNFKRRTNNIVESFHRTLNKIIPHYHPKISFLADKLKFFAIKTYQKYNNALIGNISENENSINIADDIFKFIKNFHQNYGENFDIDLLKNKFVIEKEKVLKICRDFIDIIFTDGDKYTNENNIEEGENEDIIADKDSFEIEKDNLLNKLNNLNIDVMGNENNANEIFEEPETLEEYDNVNYIKNNNGTRKLISKLKDNIIENLYIFKRK